MNIILLLLITSFSLGWLGASAFIRKDKKDLIVSLVAFVATYIVFVTLS